MSIDSIKDIVEQNHDGKTDDGDCQKGSKVPGTAPVMYQTEAQAGYTKISQPNAGWIITDSDSQGSQNQDDTYGK